LDSTRWFGKFPDRDRVIDEKQMLAAVDVEVRRLYNAKLDAMKRDLEPLRFCEVAYDLAASLRRLDVFNDIDVAPGDWLGKSNGLPRSRLDGESEYTQVADGFFLNRKQVEDRAQIVATLPGFDVWSSGESTQLAWMMAYCTDAVFVTKALHAQHWLVQGAHIREDTKVAVEVIGAGPHVQLGYERTHCVGGVTVQLCDKVVLSADDLRAEVHEPFFCELDFGTCFVTKASSEDGEGARYCCVGSDTVRQFDSYHDDFDYLDKEAEEDASQINATVRDLLAASPEMRVELALREALRNYSEVYGKSLRLEVDHVGHVKVTDLTDIAKTDAT
jgi:hypothetical protein